MNTSNVSSPKHPIVLFDWNTNNFFGLVNQPFQTEKCRDVYLQILSDKKKKRKKPDLKKTFYFRLMFILSSQLFLRGFGPQ